MTSKQKGRAASASPDQVPNEAARARLLDLDGAEHVLSELWSERPVVLVLLRHFG